MPAYEWRGPTTAIEIPDPGGSGPEPAMLFSGVVKAGSRIPADLAEDHPMVRSWLARALIVPIADPAPDPAPAGEAAPAASKRKREALDG